ncbi:BFH_collapsed_G0053660.mRNA.1.CDS.1 [Saccharomyces cerevisiae]|nr:BGP_1a_G0052880.mRNA.1.CDS.1 [Saccharomyces cerevisiae]CAI5336596.1 BFH_HP2_G0052390.mRNA.1.CDS.1 [Saccharomyces cerevisiae]CAI6799303.1 BFH_HP2_G0052390.mRNA.1.CDS.1 [Saccharomyces cerevisiae]CAI7331883.1 BGP_1a_G0052880.mRNA.1.CDS.1 [Saccharomyces cerevisiae]CAI7371063.1 BFH_collapsed_G0053660.mRNA.1.CDS.1 [Saccharomyces cerevisiae]
MFASAGQQHPQIVPKEEESILNYLLEVRSSLAKLKQNRTQYLNSKDVRTTYQHVLTKVRELDDIRKNSHETPAKSAATLIHSTELHNRVDSVLDDVFQLLSLCFLTVGLKNSAPATYASLSTVESLLEHLNESNVFTHHDLSPIKERLEEISKIVEQKNSSPAYDEDGNDDRLREIDNERKKNKIEEDLLLRAKLKHCKDEYDILEGKLEEIDPSLSTVMEKLFRIRRGLLSLVASAKKTMSKSDINTNSLLQEQNDLQTNNESLTDDKHLVSQEYVHEKLSVLKNELSELESNRDDSGKFKSLESHQVAEKGQSVLNGLLDDCHDLVNDLSHQKNGGLTLDPYLQPIYEQLIDIKTTLENLMITRRWTLRETDLFSYQKKLNEIDNKRINGKFPTKSQDSKGQSILLYLLRRCYAIIYKLLESSEPVSEALQPIHNQLSTIRRCLLELKRMGGVNNERELYPYQMKLASLDNLRTEGIFYDSDGNIPEGQGILNALLAECFDILHELKVEAEEKAQNSTSSDGSDDDDNGESGIDSNSNDSEPESEYQQE